VKEARVFFSEEKKQKTFFPALRHVWRFSCDLAACAGIKVFCSFFKKERLSYFLIFL
jgi:hypothetical protein